MLGGDPNFQASDSWLKKFKNWRTDIVVEDVKKKTPYVHKETNKKVSKEPRFVDKIAMVDRVNLYNADEFGKLQTKYDFEIYIYLQY